MSALYIISTEILMIRKFLHRKKKVVLVITDLQEVELENIKFPSPKPVQLSKAVSEIKL